MEQLEKSGFGREVPTFSPAFYIWYLIAGFTDMIDGTIAIIKVFCCMIATLAAVQEGHLIRTENHKLES